MKLCMYKMPLTYPLKKGKIQTTTQKIGKQGPIV